MTNLEKAKKIALAVHKSQLDKNKQPYVHKLITIASMLQTEDEKIVAFLEFTLENPTISLSSLKLVGFNDLILEAIYCLQKKQNQTFDDYKIQVKLNPLSVKVKIAELIHDTDLSKLAEITKKDIETNIKYNKFLQELIIYQNTPQK